MAEWLMRGTVNTFFSGSNPLDAFYCVFNIALTLRAPFGLPPLPPASEAGRCLAKLGLPAKQAGRLLRPAKQASGGKARAEPYPFLRLAWVRVGWEGREGAHPTLPPRVASGGAASKAGE